jgi:hypothetical protein
VPEQVWAVRYADRDTQIRDLPVGVIADIAKRTDVSWLLVQAAPLMDANVAQELVAAACQHNHIEPPVGLTGRQIIDLFVQVDDDLPTEFTDGIPPEAAAP